MESRDLGYLTAIVRTIILSTNNLLIKLLKREQDKQSLDWGLDWETVEYLISSLLEVNYMMVSNRLELLDLPDVRILFEASHIFLQHDWEKKVQGWPDHADNPDYRWLIHTINKLSTETSDAYIGVIVTYFNSQPFKKP